MEYIKHIVIRLTHSTPLVEFQLTTHLKGDLPMILSSKVKNLII